MHIHQTNTKLISVSTFDLILFVFSDIYLYISLQTWDEMNYLKIALLLLTISAVISAGTASRSKRKSRLVWAFILCIYWEVLLYHQTKHQCCHMYARVVFSICDGRQLLEKMNALLSSLILFCNVLSQKGERGSISASNFTSKKGW